MEHSSQMSALQSQHRSLQFEHDSLTTQHRLLQDDCARYRVRLVTLELSTGLLSILLTLALVLI